MQLIAKHTKNYRGFAIQKDKLRLYRTLKSELEREEYLDVLWDREERRSMAALRGGTNKLRVETGRWINEELKERTCSLCASGHIEDESHTLLHCFTYERERRRMFKNILEGTGIDCLKMKGDRDWLLHMLIGAGSGEREKRDCIIKAVAKFLEGLFRKRAFILESEGR